MSEARRMTSIFERYLTVWVGLCILAGMRILECLRLRVQDVDFDLGHITIRNPKGGRDRVTMLPDSTRDRLRDHLLQVRTLHDSDLADGFGSVYLPDPGRLTSLILKAVKKVGCRAIIDRGTRLEPGTRIGVDVEEDRARGFRITDSGITLVTPDMLGQQLHFTR